MDKRFDTPLDDLQYIMGNDMLVICNQWDRYKTGPGASGKAPSKELLDDLTIRARHVKKAILTYRMKVKI